MPVYLAIASNKAQEFQRVLQSKIEKQNVHQVDNQTWLIAPQSNIVTPKELCDFLGVSSGAAGQIIITALGPYYGYHTKDIWSWLNSKGA